MTDDEREEQQHPTGSGNEQCPDVFLDQRCTLERGHHGPHRNDDTDCTWDLPPRGKR